MLNQNRTRNLRWTGRFAIACVLFQVFVSGWHNQLMAMSLQLTAGPTSPVIVICSPRGLLRIVLDHDGNPVELPDPQPPTTVCIICLTVGSTDQAIAPAQLAAFQAPRATVIVYHVPGDTIADRTPFVRCGLDPPFSV